MAGVAMLVTAVMATVVQAQQPTMVFSIRGIEPLLEDADFIGTEIGQTGAKETAEQLFSAFTGGKGLAGIDQTKPLGVYSNATAGAPPMPVAFIPVSDAEALKGLLSDLAPDFKDAKGSWTATVNGTKLFGKLSGGYLFVSIAPTALTKVSDPTKIVSGKYDIALDVSFASIPEPLKEQFLDQVETGGRQALENGPEPANEAERAGRDLGFNGTIAVLKALVNDGDRLTFGIDLDAEKRLGAVDVSITGKPNTGLAKAMTAYGKTQPVFAGIGSEAAPFRMVMSYPTTGITDQLDSLFSAMRSTAEAEIEKDESLKSDADKTVAKGFANKLFDIAEATAKTGTMHSGMVLEDGGEGKIRILGGAQIAKGDEAGKLLDDVVKSPELAGKFKADVAKYAGARIHAITADQDEETEKYLGDEPIHLAIRNDSIWVSAGGANLASLKKALDQKPAMRAAVSPISIRIKPAALVLLMEKDDENLIEKAKEIAELPGDKVNLDIAAIPSGAKLRIEFGVDLFKFADQSEDE